MNLQEIFWEELKELTKMTKNKRPVQFLDLWDGGILPFLQLSFHAQKYTDWELL